MGRFEQIDGIVAGLFSRVEEKFLERAEEQGNIVAILSRSEGLRSRIAGWLREMPALVCEYGLGAQLETLLAERGSELICLVINLDDYSAAEIARLVVELRENHPWVGHVSISAAPGRHSYSRSESWPFDVALHGPLDRVSLKLGVVCAAEIAAQD
ncbi:hypothetical protein [Rhodobacter maris]|uniref:Uncharacterized protein n=1 Tax=Rhodobacter maris TaxID=446682 RepID=A0A285THR6_9RHOB|nr:hypothetical protein [Rhodobacter maris]SOC21278.1 hypothetical protein SAMN05877831_12216 [Rhodobacter maris]